jgi:ABC-type proline/glycine betaine transport system permease subunit
MAHGVLLIMVFMLAFFAGAFFSTFMTREEGESGVVPAFIAFVCCCGSLALLQIAYTSIGATP